MPRFDHIHEYPANLEADGLAIGIVMSRFNLPVCEGLLSACVAELKRLGVADGNMVIANVPGALEIPLVLITNGSLMHRPEVRRGIARVGALGGEIWFKMCLVLYKSGLKVLHNRPPRYG